MASITCRHGGTPHTHTSVPEVRHCQGAVATAIDQPFNSNKLNAAVQAVRTCTSCGVPTGEVHAIGCPGDASERARYRANSKVEEPGIYRTDDGAYYKVQQSRESGRLYAKRGTKDAGKWFWAYEKGAIFNILTRHKLTADQAAEFGKVEGVCVMCFRSLTHEESMDRGYGPVCADNNGWPYDHNRKG